MRKIYVIQFTIGGSSMPVFNVFTNKEKAIQFSQDYIIEKNEVDPEIVTFEIRDGHFGVTRVYALREDYVGAFSFALIYPASLHDGGETT